MRVVPVLPSVRQALQQFLVPRRRLAMRVRLLLASVQPWVTLF